jgi:hypothetical protein
MNWTQQPKYELTDCGIQQLTKRILLPNNMTLMNGFQQPNVHELTTWGFDP